MVEEGLTTALIVGAANLSVGVLMIGIGGPLAAGRVKRNHWYGVRTRKALASDENWYELNRFGGRLLVRGGWLVAALGLSTFFVPMHGPGEGGGWWFWPLSLAAVWVVMPITAAVLWRGRGMPG